MTIVTAEKHGNRWIPIIILNGSDVHRFSGATRKTRSGALAYGADLMRACMPCTEFDVIPLTQQSGV